MSPLAIPPTAMLTTVSMLNDLIESAHFGATPSVTKGSYTPRYNVRIEGDTATFEIALPGYDKSNIEVRCTDRLLTVSSNVKRSYSGYVVAGSRVGPFSLSWVNRGATVSRATFTNGVLEIVMQSNVSENGDLVAID